jgi:Domain of unknown function (DUF4265)
MQKDKVKLTIKLTEEQIGQDPISTETLWFEIVGKFHRVKNVPLFIDDISYDDLISVEKIGDNLFEIVRIEEHSKNSTIWIFVRDRVFEEKFLNDIRQLECDIEGGAFKDYYAINVPKKVDIKRVYALIDHGVAHDVLAADYPSIRH